MLTHPTLNKLQALKFTGMAAALAEQMKMPDIAELAFADPAAPTILRDKADASALYVLMPMRV